MDLDYKFSRNKQANEKWKRLFTHMMKVGDINFCSVKEMSRITGLSTTTIYKFLKNNSKHPWVIAMRCKRDGYKNRYAINLFFISPIAKDIVERHTPKFDKAA